jgi:hypothetical protein
MANQVHRHRAGTTRRWSCPAYLGTACLILLSVAATSRAADHFLTIGGGSSAENNQVSLEKNVLFLQKSLADSGLGGVPHEILFTDGNAGSRDLVYVDPNNSVPRVNILLGEIFDHADGLDEQYRAHAIPKLWGPSGRQGINKWFDTIGSKLADGDRLFIYFTGHGGSGRGRPPADQTLAMWNEPGMTVHEFNALLDKLPPKVSVVLIMVQCFGGGFADVIFDGADPGKGLSPRNRCGFFATLPTRVAAGCTSDVDEENYKEYSTYFWAALYGKTRLGERVAPPDFDGDGKVSLAEAHAYALIHSDTIDISMKTSDVFLRKYGSYRAQGDLLQPDTDFDRLVAAATPTDKAVLEGLSAALALEGADRVRDARAEADKLSQHRKTIERNMGSLRDARNQLGRALQAHLKSRWPELGNPLHPQGVKILTAQGDDVVRWIESAPAFKDFDAKGQEIDRLDDQSTDLERRWVKYQRFIRTAESVALAANLPKVAKPEILDRYKRLVELEDGEMDGKAD